MHFFVQEGDKELTFNIIVAIIIINGIYGVAELIR